LKENFDRFKILTIYKEKEMVDFRRMIPVLAVLALLLSLSVPASAQLPLTCIASGGVPNQVPGEALTARMGDFVITCTGGTATPYGQPIPSVNISVTLGTINITSRLMSTSATLPQLSEAVVTLDEPLSPPLAIGQFGCAASVCTNLGNGAGLPLYAASASSVNFGNKNIFQGTQVSNNQLTFFGVPVDPPGTSGQRIFRVTNVRGNASQAGISNVATQIFETMSVSNPALLPVTNLATQAVASVQRGLIFSLGTGSGTGTFATLGLQQCVSRTATDSTNPAIATLNYQEGFGTAFLKRNVSTSSASPLASGEQNTLGNVPPGPYFTESGYTTANTTLQANTIGGACPGGTCAIGQADFGTRLKAVFNNIPAGVSIFVDRIATANGGADVAQMTASETGTFTAVSATSGAPGGTIASGFGATQGAAAQLTITNNSATAVWEVTDASPVSLATFKFRVWVIYTASPGTNSPALATATVNGSYAPTSTVTTPAAGTVPRFAIRRPRRTSSRSAPASPTCCSRI